MAHDDWYNPDTDDFCITFRMSSWLHSKEEWPCITKIVGTATRERRGDDGVFRTRIGRLVGCRIYGERIFRDGLSVWDHVEHLGEQMQEYYRAVFDDGYNFTPIIRRLFPDACNSDVLVLHRTSLVPEARGRGLGTMMVRRFIDLYANDDGLVVCRPFPEQFRARGATPGGEFEGLTLNRSLALCKVRDHARRMGFTRLGSAEYFVHYPAAAHDRAAGRTPSGGNPAAGPSPGAVP